MTVDEEADHLPILSNDGSRLNGVKDFLGSYVADPWRTSRFVKGKPGMHAILYMPYILRTDKTILD